MPLRHINIDQEAVKNNKPLYKNGWLWSISIFLLIILPLTASLNKADDASQQEGIKNSKTETLLPGSFEVKDLGKWFGIANVYLGASDGKFVATFDPFIKKTQESISIFAVSIIDEIWGKSLLAPGLYQIESRNGANLIYYNTNDGGKIYILVANDIESGKIASMSFWKEK
ncbi:MAG: hypothetical protein PHG66_04065 [Candidatus Colwellbacteria bacterium]|nr:hypothetical protein [Candidatus Colwellbacteria bacterium]